jgi:hypothetical protein
MFAGEKLSWLLVCAVQNSMLTYLISKKTEARSTKFETISKYEFSNVPNIEKNYL